MSIISGLIENDKIYMGCDSQISCSSYGDKNNYSIVNKVIRKENMLIGVSGYYRDINILLYRFTPPKRRKLINTEEYIFVDFLDSLIRVLENNKRITTDEGMLSIKDSSFLIGYDCRLFTIESDLSLNESKEDFQCIGCGYRYSLGAFEVMKDLLLTPEEKILKSLEAASKYDLYCGAPFQLEII